ncbi:DUF1344 domain-containing protein [Mesorhizobium sp. B1-1-8]|uniref:DUF1344 domain-containing protein n=1 Tax=Mesorhizobium sp. B1-1-8 TaxID=2589976 RepID=UPI00112623A0|nr:DUF1344 domain-containing protein [Mesorhizobium sp. B1-1-8]UCI10575.1 DUF1344 domain-containing protein [Mesorhizobium sp. B1-1-8]
MKKKSVIAAATILAIASATGAYAKAAAGTIASIDKKGDSITMSDGKTFTLPEGIEAETLKVGEKVTVTYSTNAGKLAASSIQPAK